MRKNQGFTLVNILVAICIISLFVTIIIVLVASNIRNAKYTQAKGDTYALADAVAQFVFDLRYYPPSSPPGIPPTIPQYLRLLHGPGKVPRNDPNVPDSQYWLSVSTNGYDPYQIDTFANQLIRNTPKGSSAIRYYTGPRWPRWRGAYITTVKADPWGNQYSCVISTGRGNFCGVICAGPNGIVETDAIQKRTNFVRGGDDIIAYLK